MVPTLNTEACVGCFSCVSACPCGVLAEGDGKVSIANPDSCCGCEACAGACPAGALTF